MGRLRDLARRLWGLPPAPRLDSREARQQWKQEQLALDAAEFAANEARRQRHARRERKMQSELLKAELEARGGVKFPND